MTLGCKMWFHDINSLWSFHAVASYDYNEGDDIHGTFINSIDNFTQLTGL